jgi:antitoxin (DNA-binding transcriptional repressor) of toxin-antitoxin stability system
MESVGTCEAKTHLTRLWERMAKEARIVFTHRGKAVAMLVPPELNQRWDAAAIGRAMLAYRDRVGRRLVSNIRRATRQQ